MTGQVIYLYGGPYEARIRLSGERAPHSLPYTATIIVLPFEGEKARRLMRAQTRRRRPAGREREIDRMLRQHLEAKRRIDPDFAS